jgi:K+-transporting ATPase ATPase C chain
MNMLKEIKTTVSLTLLLLVVCCVLYPVFVFGLGQMFFEQKADGSLVMGADGKPIASTLLGQSFTADKYFNPRPSAAGQGYDSTSSSGSNLGSTSQSLHDNVKQRVADYRKANGLPDTQLVPADAVTASGSGLDPHISMNEDDLKALVDKYTDGRDFGILGDPGVNIVKLNLALDGKFK